MEAFHAQKWSARETPPTAASASSLEPIRFQSRHSPLATRKTPTMSREKPNRQTAMARGSAFDRRTSGAANAIPKTKRRKTRTALLKLKKKKDGWPGNRSFFQRNFSPLFVF